MKESLFWLHLALFLLRGCFDAAFSFKCFIIILDFLLRVHTTLIPFPFNTEEKTWFECPFCLKTCVDYCFE